MSIADKTIRVFLSEIAKKPGTPAGGSIASLCAASAASMTEMAIRHTINKVKDPYIRKDLNKSLLICSFYRHEFMIDMDRDTRYYHELITTMQMETNTQIEKNKKNLKLQKCYKESVNIPLEITYKVHQLLEVIAKIIDQGNENYLSDGIGAYLLAKSAMQSLIYHIKFNLIFIEDVHFVERISSEIELFTSQWELQSFKS